MRAYHDKNELQLDVKTIRLENVESPYAGNMDHPLIVMKTKLQQ